MASIKDTLESIYSSLKNNNEDIDIYIQALKEALNEAGEKTVIVDSKRLAQNNRQGRKTMQAYFKKRGVDVTFSGE